MDVCKYHYARFINKDRDMRSTAEVGENSLAKEVSAGAHSNNTSISEDIPQIQEGRVANQIADALDRSTVALAPRFMFDRAHLEIRLVWSCCYEQINVLLRRGVLALMWVLVKMIQKI